MDIVERKWGYYKILYEGDNQKVKLIVLNPKSSISLQKHLYRSEHWVVVEGVATAIVQTDKCKIEQIVQHNESIFVPMGAVHKLKNEQDIELKIIEVQIGSYLGEDDIIRYD